MNEAPGTAGPSDLFEIYYAPSEVYERRKEGSFGLPLVVFVIATILLYFVTRDLLRPVTDAEWRLASRTMMEKNPQITADQIAGFKAMGEKFSVVAIAIYAVVGPLLAGLLLWIVSKFAGLKARLPVAITIAVFALYPMLIEFIANAVQMFVVSEDSVTSRFSLSLGPARFLRDASPSTLALVGHIDLFTIWIAVLMFIGLKVAVRATTAQAATVAVVMWLLGFLPAVISAAR
jgi:hypothetical protein